MSQGHRSSEAGRTERGGFARAPVPADVGIVAAMSMEVGYLVDQLRRVRKYQAASMPVIEGELGGKIVAIAIGGMGREAARHATSILLDGHRPNWVVSAGFAGALNPSLNRYDLILPAEVIDLEGERFPVDRPGHLVGIGAGPEPRTLVTVDQVILGAAEKRRLHEETGADLVDMETSAVAAVCAQRLVRFLPVRIISDDARVDLPREVASLMTKSGSYRFGAALRAIWDRPSSLKDFWSLHEQALEAADRLATFLVRCLSELPV